MRGDRKGNGGVVRDSIRRALIRRAKIGDARDERTTDGDSIETAGITRRWGIRIKSYETRRRSSRN